MFTAKRRVDEPGTQARKAGLEETLAEVLWQDPAQSRYTQVKRTKKQKYKDFVDSSQEPPQYGLYKSKPVSNYNSNSSYLDNYKKLKENQEKEGTK